MSSILLQQSPPVATLTLNRPDVRNAFDDELIQTLGEHLINLENDDNVRVLMIKGAGAHFCAGADAHWMQKMIGFSKTDNHKDALAFAQVLHKLDHFSKPTLAITQGSVFGGGIGLMACVDIVLSTPDALFCFSEVKLGLVPAVISPYVISAIGPHHARRYMLTAEPFYAEEAHRIGLVHEVVQKQGIQPRADQLVQAILKNGPKAIRASKELIHTLADENLNVSHKMEHTANLIANIRVSEEAQEGLNAFLQKRSAEWPS